MKLQVKVLERPDLALQPMQVIVVLVTDDGERHEYPVMVLPEWMPYETEVVDINFVEVP